MTGVRNTAARPAGLALLLVSTALGPAMLATPVRAQAVVDGASPVGPPAGHQARFDIPAQAMTDALPLFGRQAGLQVSINGTLADGLATPGVVGTMNPALALDRLLAGTGLFGTIANGTVLVQASAVSLPGDGGAMRLGSVQVSGATLPVEDSYTPPPSSVATKTTLSVRETPFTVNQVTEEVIRERGDVNIFETLEGFAGVSTVSSNADIGQGISRSINVRGFDLAASGQTLINGQRTYSTGSQNRNADNLERVELLRGPAALYYGAAQPGGIINYVYKRPKAVAKREALFKTDTAGSYGGTIDFTGPLTEDGTLLYRAVGNYTRYEDDQDKIFSNPVSTLGALTWAPSPAFSTNLTYEYYDFESVPEQENNKLDAITGEYFPVPRDFFFGSTNDRAVRTTHTVIWDANWAINDWVKMAAMANFVRADQWYQNTRIVGGGRGGVPAAVDANGNLPRYISLSPDSEYENFSGGVDFTGDFMTGGFTHEWLVGGGIGQTRTRSATMPPSISCLYGQSSANNANCPRPLVPRSLAPDPVNVLDPSYGPWPYAYLRDEAVFVVPWAKRKDRNIYLQDLITLPNGTTRVMVAMGWSGYENLGRGSYNWATGLRADDTKSKADKWSPRLAITQDIGDHTTVYASYGESFNPQASLTLRDEAGSALLTPEEGIQYEVGYKRDLFGGEGLLQASLFRVEKKNVARDANADTCDVNIVDPADPDFCYSLLDGLQRSQGAEIEVSGNLTAWWSTSMAYSYLDAKVKRSNDLPNLNKQLPYIPRHSLSLWNRFRVAVWNNGADLALGVGMKAYSSVNNGYDAAGDTDRNPGYALFNAGLFYRMPVGDDALKVSLNVNNLFDKTYYDRRRYYNSGTIIWGNERRASLTVEWGF